MGRNISRRELLSRMARFGAAATAVSAFGFNKASVVSAQRAAPEPPRVRVADVIDATRHDFARGSGRGIGVRGS